MNNDNDITYKVYNQQKFFVEVKLYNPDGDVFILNPQAILHLVIEDDLHFWPIRGFFIYENPYEIIERKMVSNEAIDAAAVAGMDAARSAQLKAFKPYGFRNDGRDYVDITIRPELIGTSNLSIKNLPSHIWEMNYKCVIYDKEDIDTPDISRKLKKFYFWDKSYQEMLDKKIQWSTATSKENITYKQYGVKYNPSLATDNERKMFTGDAIKDILSVNNFKVTTKKELFDKGSTKIFYTTFHDRNIWENIEYILAYHMSEKTTVEPISQTDICIFNQDRYTKEFELLPIYKIFEKAGNTAYLPKEFQIEHLFFDNVGDVGDSSTCPYKAPYLDERSTTTDIKISKIKKYRYVDMAGADNTQMIVTTPVHTYDFKNKTFSINISNSNVDTLEEKLKKIYIENKVLTVNGLHPILTLNQGKTSNKTINPIYTTRANQATVSKAGLGRLLYSSLFLNQCLIFEVDGATLRQPGRFVGIDRQTYSDNALDYKLCGQWFITNVKHNFFHNMYLNEVTAVKMHSYDNLNIKKDTP